MDKEEVKRELKQIISFNEDLEKEEGKESLKKKVLNKDLKKNQKKVSD